MRYKANIFTLAAVLCLSFMQARIALAAEPCLELGQLESSNSNNFFEELLEKMNSLAYGGAAQGTSSGGGGSTIVFRERGQVRPFLLDRLTLNPGLAFQEKAAEGASSKLSPSDEKIKLSVLDRSDIAAALNLAEKKLKSWEDAYKKQFLRDDTAASLGLLVMIRESLGKMSFLRTKLNFNVIDRYELLAPFVKMKPEIQMPILYLPQYGAIISESQWNGLDIETQAGLLVHEAIRQMQGLYKYDDLSDHNLQAITAKIMDWPPSEGGTFASNLSGSPKLLRRSIVNGYQQDGTRSANTDPADLALAKLVSSYASGSDGLLASHQSGQAIHLSEKDISMFLLELKKSGILKGE